MRSRIVPLAPERPRTELRVLAVTNLWPQPHKPMRGVWTERQMRSLVRHGVAVDVLPVAGREHLPSSLGVYGRAGWEIFKLNFRPGRYDVVHAHTGHCGVLACLQLRCPVVMSYVGYDLDVQAENRENARAKTERVVFRALSLVLAATIAKSARGAERLPRRARTRNAVIPNGVDRALFAPVERSTAREALGWHPDRPVALFPADPRRQVKRFSLARTAVEHARSRRPDLELLVSDSAPPDDVPLLMSAADVLLLTSVGEGSPNVVKEAMACNLPVVSVDVGDVRVHLDGTRNCHVCPADPQRLADAIVAVIDALPDRSDGRARSEHLGLDPIAVRIRDVYRRARERGPGVLGWRRADGTRHDGFQRSSGADRRAASAPP